MYESKATQILINNNMRKEQLQSNCAYIKQKPYVSESGIYEPCESYVPEGCVSHYKCIMTKEMFVEAYKKFIDKPKRLYKGGWSRRKR